MKETNTMKTAFTLIEILIVVILLGVLAAIVVPQFADSKESAAVSACKANAKAVLTASALYRLKEGQEASTMSDLTTASDATEHASGVAMPYLPAGMTCPTTDTDTYDVPTGDCTTHDAVVPVV
jgi:prepilin-type N-terminal cleavage/methylation domain-containing protein